MSESRNIGPRSFFRQPVIKDCAPTDYLRLILTFPGAPGAPASMRGSN